MVHRARRFTLFAFTILAATLSVTIGAAGPARTSKLDSALRSLSSGDVQVIVRARSGHRSIVRDHLLQKGAVLKEEHALIDSITARLHASQLPALDLDQEIAGVSLDVPMINMSANEQSPGAGAASALAATLGLPIQGVNGRGVGVVVIDSGLDPSRDFAPADFFDFTPTAGYHAYDDYGHGTHVSGLIASKGVLSATDAGPLYPGIAPKAHLISLKVLDAHGVAMTSTVIDAIEFAVANRRALDVDVINISLGHPIFEPAATDPLVQAVEAATRAGIVVVVAAGNVGRSIHTGEPGYAGILSPGNAESAITVGAVDAKDTVTRRDDSIPSYSSRGPTWYDARPKPDVVAPGHDLVSDAAAGSTLALEHPDHVITVDGSKGRFLRMSGTSQATAVTTGVVALVIDALEQAGRPVTPAIVKNILAYTAIPMGGYDGLTQGHGAINAAGAVALAKALGSSPPIVPFTPIGNDRWRWSQSTTFPKSLVAGNGTSLPFWAQTIVWGTSVDGDTIVWGTALDGTDGDTIVWGTMADGDTIVWGTTVDGDTIVWGTNIDGDTIVWGTSVDGDTIVWGTTIGGNLAARAATTRRGGR